MIETRLILDLSKAFDKVAHKRLLLKLEYYGIRGLVLAWIKAWLIGRTQQVALEGEFSEKSCVRSGVPQGTVLLYQNNEEFEAAKLIGIVLQHYTFK